MGDANAEESALAEAIGQGSYAELKRSEALKETKITYYAPGGQPIQPVVKIQPKDDTK